MTSPSGPARHVIPLARPALNRGGAREQLEDRMAKSVGDVLVDRLVDPDPEIVQDADRRAGRWPDHGAQEPRALIRREGLAHDGSSGLRSQLDRVNDVGVATFRHDRLT